jgi:hypothetical protein
MTPPGRNRTTRKCPSTSAIEILESEDVPVDREAIGSLEPAAMTAVANGGSERNACMARRLRSAESIAREAGRLAARFLADRLLDLAGLERRTYLA